jgi:hypothetical protein
MRGDVNKGLGRSPRGLAHHETSAGIVSTVATRSRLHTKEISERKQVGDAESMINEEKESMINSSYGTQL